MKKTIVAAAALCAALSATDAAAQTPLPISLEVRAGAAFPSGDIDGAKTGYTFGANVAYGFTPALEGYLSYSQAAYSPEDDGEDVDAKLKDKGLGLGLRYSFPVPGTVRPWVSVGLARRSVEIDVDGGGVSLDPEIGLEAGAGVAFSVAPRVSITPGVSYSTVSFEDDGADFKMAGIRLDVGARIAL